tara:strand:+ start:316 stop:516 length:201 start_codon:yes stop_codon:yes gene_type:complete
MSGIDADASYEIKSSNASNLNLLSLAAIRLHTLDFPLPRPPMTTRFFGRLVVDSALALASARGARR